MSPRKATIIHDGCHNMDPFRCKSVQVLRASAQYHMGIVGEVGINLDDFALGHTLTTIDELSCEAERLVANDPERVMPFLWVEAPISPLDQLEDAFATDDTVDNVNSSQISIPNGSIN